MASKSYFTDQVTGLYNGVSTLPELTRVENQAEEQINFVSNVSRGLESRNGTDYVAALNLDTQIDTNSLVTKIDKDTRVRNVSTSEARTIEDDYILVFTGKAYDGTTNPFGGLEIYDKNGVQQVFSNPSSHTYLETSNPIQDIRTALIEDYLIISNASVKTAMDDEITSPAGDLSKAIVFIKTVQPSATYSININGTQVASYVTSTSNETFATVANGLQSSFSSTGITATVSGSNVILTKDDGSSIRDVKVEGLDTFANTLLGVVNGEVARYDDLPAAAPDGTIVNIVGVDAQNEFANYYVKYDATSTVWKETIAPNLETTIDVSTMPHFLIKTGTSLINPATDADDGITRAEFQLVTAGDTGLANQRSAQSYADRLVGDNDSNPIPSFIGSSIIDILFYRNRLVYLSKDSLVMSRSNDYFNLFSDSAIRALNSDPIDIFIATNYSVRAKAMQSYPTGLIIFAEEMQFAVHSSTEALTPATVRLEQITQYQTNEDVHPISISDHVLFAGSKGNNAVIRRFSTKSGNLIKDAIEITGHVDTYIPNNVRFMFGLSNKNILFVATNDDLKTLYVYTSYMQNQKLVQESWSKFQFNFDIMGAVTFGNTIFFVDKSGSNNSISKLELFDHTKELQIDQFVEPTTQDTAGDGSAQFTLPYKVEEDNTLIGVSIINNKVEETYPTIRTSVAYPDSDLDQYAYSSQAKVPELKPYIPDEISLTGSYIEDYNADYNKALQIPDTGYKAYKQVNDHRDRTLISFNSSTDKYEIKGLGTDPNFADFVGDYSSPPTPKILPANNLDDNSVNTNNWKININKNGTGEERDTFGNFVGMGVGALKSNFVQSPLGSTGDSKELNITMSGNFSSNNRPASVILASQGRANETDSDYIVVSKAGETSHAKVDLRFNENIYSYYILNIFDDTWKELRFTFYNGILNIYNYDTKVTVYDSLGSDRKVVDRVEAAIANIAYNPLTLMTEPNTTTTTQGYISDFKIEKVDRTHEIVFEGALSSTSNDMRYYQVRDINTLSLGLDDGASLSDAFVGYFMGTKIYLDVITESLNDGLFPRLRSEDYTIYIEMTKQIIDLETGEESKVWNISNYNNSPNTYSAIALIKDNDLNLNPPASGWNNTLVEDAGVPVGFDTYTIEAGDVIELNSHNLTDKFKITMLGSFGNETNSEDSDAIYYSNHADAQGITDTGIFYIGREGTTNTSVLGFIPKNATNHKIFEPSNPFITPILTHRANTNERITGLNALDVPVRTIPIVDSNDILTIPTLDPTLTISSVGTGSTTPQVKAGIRLTSTDSSDYFNTYYMLQGGTNAFSTSNQTWIKEGDYTSPVTRFTKTIANSGASNETLTWELKVGTTTQFKATWNKFKTYNEDEGVVTEENPAYPHYWGNILWDTADDSHGYTIPEFTITQETFLKFINASAKKFYDVTFSDGTLFTLEEGTVNVLSTDNIAGTFSSGVTFTNFEDFEPSEYNRKTFSVQWGDNANETITSPVSHTYSEGVPTYVNGVQKLYFDGMISGHSSMKKVEVEYNNGNVVVKIDSEEKVLYEDAGLTTTKSSINTFNGFSYNSILPKIGNITTFDTTNEDFLYKGIPVAAKDKGADLKLRFFKLDILDGTGVNNIFDYRFEDNTNNIVLDEDSSTNNAIYHNSSSSSSTWTTPTPTLTTKLHYEFNNSTEEDSSVSKDTEGSKAGSKVTDSSPNLLHATMNINSIQKYSDCWITPPSVNYYDRTVKFGYPTVNSYTLSKYFLQKNGQSVATGRLNLKALEVSFAEAVYFDLEITPEYRDTYIKQFSTGVGQTTSDTINVEKGKHKFGLNALAEHLTLTLKNKSPFKTRFTALGYEGSYINRSKVR